MAMPKEHKLALDKTLEVLVDDLDITPVVSHMRSKNILKDQDENDINSKTSSEEKVTEFVKLLKRRSKSAFPAFQEYLENCEGSEHLAEELEENLKSANEEASKNAKEELNVLEVQREQRRQTDKWRTLEEHFYRFTCDHDNIDRFEHIPDKINILMIGKTGSGKSATGNTIIGKHHFHASGSSGSVTKTIQTKSFTEERFKITIIDTPGLFDTAKDFSNKDLVLEIAKTMMHFEGGIHLFLLILSSSGRYTNEEQATVKDIEKALSKNFYNNCVLILTHALGKFGHKSSPSLQEYVKGELVQGGKFGDLIMQVSKRVIAVENSFEEAFLEKKHRQRLICSFAQIIQENKGLVYSNKSFEKAKKDIAKQDEERKKRSDRKEVLTTMKSRLHSFLLEKYLKDSPAKKLGDLLPVMKKETLFIKANARVAHLESIEDADIVSYLETFVQENDKLIGKMRETKIKRSKLQKQQESRKKELEEKEEMKKLQNGIGPLVSNYLQQLTVVELERLKESKELPIHEMNHIIKSLKVKIDRERIKDYTRQTFFEHPATEIQRCIDEKLSKESLDEKTKQIEKAQRDSKIRNTIKKLKCNLPVVLEGKSDEELYSLISDLQHEGKSASINLDTLFDRLVGYEIKDTDISVSEISAIYLKGNRRIIQSMLTIIQLKRQNDDQDSCKRRDQKVNLALRTLEAKLPSALEEKSDDDLSRLQNEGERGESPSAGDWALLFGELIESEIKHTDITIEEIFTLLIENNYTLLESSLSDIRLKRQNQLEAKKNYDDLIRDHSMETLLAHLREAMEKKSEKELEQLTHELTKTEPHDLSVWETLFYDILGKDIEHSGVSIREITTLFLDKYSNKLKSVLEGSIVKRQNQRDDEIEQRQHTRTQSIQAIIEMLVQGLPKALEETSDKKLHQLYNDLNKWIFHGPGSWEPLMDSIVGDSIPSDLSSIEIYQLYFETQGKYLTNFSQTLLEKRQNQQKAHEVERYELLRNSAFATISNIIKEEVKTYITGQTVEELFAMEREVKNNKVPIDVFDKVCQHLPLEERKALKDWEIKEEIMLQILEQDQVIRNCVKEAGWCFAGSSQVHIKGVGISKISKVQVNDEVLVYDHGNGHIFYDKVYLISHAKEDENMIFVQLKTSSGTELLVSPGHLLPVGSICNDMAADEVSCDDVIFTLRDGVMTSDLVTSVSYEVCRGAYCPMTMNGTIVVNDVAASCYTTFLPSRLAHVLLSPIRLLFNYLPLPLFDKFLPYDTEEGMPVLLLKCRSMINMWRILIENVKQQTVAHYLFKRHK